MTSKHPAGTRLSSGELAAGLRNRATKVRPDDAGSAHWMDLAAARIEQLETELKYARDNGKAKASGVNRRARRALKSKKSTRSMIGDRQPSPAQINGYRPKTKPSTLRGGYGSGR